MAEDSLEDYELEVPDIIWDINRETNQPTESNQPTSAPPSFDQTPSPSPPPSVGPTSSPSFSPTSEPTNTLKPTYSFYRVTTAPVTPSPVTRSPVTYSPITPSPAVTSLPTPTSSASLVPSSPPVSDSKTSTTTFSSSPVEVRTTYFSCPPPPSQTVQHGTTIVQVETQTSIVGIKYAFQVQLTESEDIAAILPHIESHLESTLGEYLKSHTEDGYDKNQCRGYNVEDFRRRKLTNTTSSMKNGPTKIVAVSTIRGMSVDETRLCDPENENCHVIYGGLEATYIGNNEAGVKSSISRVIKEEVVDESEYEMEYIQADDESYGYVSPDSKTIPITVSSAQAITPESLIKSSRITKYGMGILAALGSAFMVLCFVAFVKGGSKKKKNARRELKNAKRNALGEGEDLRQSDKHNDSYDMESVKSYPDTVSDDGVEVEYPRKIDSAANAIVGAEGAESSGDSGRPKRWWKKADDDIKVAVTAIAATSAAAVATTAIVPAGDGAQGAKSSGYSGKIKCWWKKADDTTKADITANSTTSAAIVSVDSVDSGCDSRYCSVDSVDSGHDSGMTWKWWNKANDSVTALGEAPVADGIDNCNQTSSTLAKKPRLSSQVVVEDVDEDSDQSLNEVPSSEQASGFQFLPSLPNFFASGNAPLVDRMPSTLSESSVSTDGSRASLKSSSGLTHRSDSSYRSTAWLTIPSAKNKLPSISEADLQPPKTDTPHVGFFQRPRVRFESPPGFSRSPSNVSLNSVKTEKWDVEGEI